MKRVVSVSNWLASLALSLTLSGLCAGQGIAADQSVVDLVNRKVLRVCADPHNIPFSNEAKEGFENKIADIIASELKVPVENIWYPMAPGFVRLTLLAKRCDVIMGYAQGDELVLNTNAYYRSTYALIYKEGSGLDGVDSLSDPRLKDKKIGVVANTPPGMLMVKYGLMTKAKPYQLVVDTRFSNSAEEMANDVRSGAIDAGVVWGPLGGYYAVHGEPKLVIKALAPDPSISTRMSYGVTLGVRPSDTDWKKQLNTILLKRRADIDKVLLSYGVPMVDEDDKPITAPRS